MGLTESVLILKSVRFVKPDNFKWNGEIFVSLFIDMPCYVLNQGRLSNYVFNMTS